MKRQGVKRFIVFSLVANLPIAAAMSVGAMAVSGSFDNSPQEA